MGAVDHPAHRLVTHRRNAARRDLCDCYASLPAAICGVAVYLDDKHLGDVPQFFNNANQHLTLPMFFYPITLGRGPHTITRRRIIDTTTTDQNDAFSVWVVD